MTPEYYSAHRQEILAKRKAAYAANPEKFRKAKRLARAADPHRYRSNKLRSTYGLSLEKYEALLASQDGKCAICRENPRKGRGNGLYVDHDHSTGRVRGILCHDCNLALGALRDRIDLFEAAVAYLRLGHVGSGQNPR